MTLNMVTHGDNAKEEETVKHGNSQPGLRCNDIWALTPLLCLCSGCNEEMLEKWVKTGADFGGKMAASDS